MNPYSASKAGRVSGCRMLGYRNPGQNTATPSIFQIFVVPATLNGSASLLGVGVQLTADTHLEEKQNQALSKRQRQLDALCQVRTATRVSFDTFHKSKEDALHFKHEELLKVRGIFADYGPILRVSRDKRSPRKDTNLEQLLSPEP